MLKNTNEDFFYIKDDLDSFGEEAFIYASNYIGEEDAIVIPNTFEDKKISGIGEKAFLGNKYIKTVIIEEGIEIVGFESFRECSNLQTILFPSTITEIKEYALTWCDELKNIIFADGIKRLDITEFLYLETITSIHIPKSVEEIYGLDEESIIIPDNLSIKIDFRNRYFAVKDGKIVKNISKKIRRMS